MIISDGTGTGQKAGVDINSRLGVRSIDSTKDFDINSREGKVWSLPFDSINPDGSNDIFFYLKNNSSTSDMKVSDIRIHATATGVISVKKVSGTASGGTDISPVSRNSNFAPIPSVTAQTGTDITGLTDDGVLFYIPVDATGKLIHLRTSSNIILGTNGAIALEWSAASGDISGIVSLIENEDDLT